MALVDFPTSLIVVAVGLTVYCLGWIVYARTLHPLSKVPGPWLASVSRTWYMYHVARGDMEKEQRRLHAQHGRLIRIAPDELSCADPEAIRTIYRIQGALDKTDFYPPWNSGGFSPHRDMFTETSDKKHGERRRIVNHVYTLGNVLKSEKYIDGCSKVFLQRLGEQVGSDNPFDLGHWLQMYAFDVIGEMYFGRAFGFLEKSEDHNRWIHSLDLLMPFLCTTCVAPSFLRPLIMGSALVVPGALTALKSIGATNAAAKEVVRQRLARGPEVEGKQRTDLLEQLYAIHIEKGSKVDFGIGDIEQEAWVALFAGSDTTAIAFRGVFYNLMKHPKVYVALQREIDEAAAAGRLSSPVRYAEAVQLPLLCATVKEALRTHPGVQLTMPRLAPRGGLEACDFTVPEGYRVGINAAVVHHDTGVFGDDAAEFRPTRWLEDRDSAARMDRYMLHFGAGTRTCIGKNISLAEIHKLVPEVLRQFEFDMWDEEAEWKTSNLWFCKQTGIHVRVTRRDVPV
ncbi:cytochrome P450 oxidoreductase [Xylariaceae sp. FL0804]|nr:cytochrome P450 oxidoreductase [Xylariaceae sp. FL0804]